MSRGNIPITRASPSFVFLFSLVLFVFYVVCFVLFLSKASYSIALTGNSLDRLSGNEF